MDLISAARSQQPVQQRTAPPPVERATNPAAAQSTQPVGEVMRRDSLQALSGTAAQASLALADRNSDRHPASEARAAAQAAREAYIKASIAAGLSPLPLP